MRKHFAIAALALALTAGSAMTSLAAGFVSTSQGMKYQWGDGSYCTNNWVQYRNHWFYFGNDQLMRTGWIQRDGSWYFAADSGEQLSDREKEVITCVVKGLSNKEIAEQLYSIFKGNSSLLQFDKRLLS